MYRLENNWMLTGFFIANLIALLFWLLVQMGPTALPYEHRLAQQAHASDDQFLARMPPDVSDEVALRVRRMLADVSGFQPDEIWPESRLVDLMD